MAALRRITTSTAAWSSLRSPWNVVLRAFSRDPADGTRARELRQKVLEEFQADEHRLHDGWAWMGQLQKKLEEARYRGRKTRRKLQYPADELGRQKRQEQHEYWQNQGEKVRYPRLGSFEIIVVVPKKFAPPSSGLPEIIPVWSKLQTRKWPHPVRLASSLAELLSAAQDGQQVSEELKDLKGRLFVPPKVEKPATSPHPPMFFGLTPRGGTPTPVERRIPGERSVSPNRSTSPRPHSAVEFNRPSSPPKPRPSSAQQMRGSGGSPPSFQSETKAPESVSALEISDPGASEDAPPSFRGDVGGPGTANEPQAVFQTSGQDGYEEQFEGDESPAVRGSAGQTDAPPSFRGDAGGGAGHTTNEPQDEYEEQFEGDESPAVRGSAGQSASSSARLGLALPTVAPDSPSPRSSAGSATPSNKKNLADLGQRLVQKNGRSARPVELLRAGGNFVPQELLEENDFKRKVYHLGVFSDPYKGFNFAGLFKELAVDGRASLQSLIDELQPFFESDETFEEASSGVSPTTMREAVVPASRVSPGSPVQDDYDEDEFEEEVPPTTPAKPAAASSDSQDFAVDIPLDEASQADRSSVASPSRSASERGGTAMGHYQTDDFEEVVSEEEEEVPRPISPPKPAMPAPGLGIMPPSGPPAMPPAMAPAMAPAPELGRDLSWHGSDYDEAFEEQSEGQQADTISEAEDLNDPDLYPDRVSASEGSQAHDYAENFENYSDGIEEVPEESEVEELS
ncbi:Hypothetical protein SCF082_LOCUS18084 [Durusdinium trenchii]|uniref:Uncharacterized protein n=1 Tax=Durusdinium trenchii TaxID=1381693 RepID=A0ABP0KLT8_9DINO